MGTFTIRPFSIADSLTPEAYGSAYVDLDETAGEVAYIPVHTDQDFTQSYPCYLLGHNRSIQEYSDNEYYGPVFHSVVHYRDASDPWLKVKFPTTFAYSKIYYNIESNESTHWDSYQFLLSDTVVSSGSVTTDGTSRSVAYSGSCDEVRLGYSSAGSSGTMQFAFMTNFGIDYEVAGTTFNPTNQVVGRQCTWNKNDVSYCSYIVVFENESDIQTLINYMQYGVVFDPGTISSSPGCIQSSIFVERVTADSGYKVVIEGPTTLVNMDSLAYNFYSKTEPTDNYSDKKFLKMIGAGLGLNFTDGTLRSRLDDPINFMFPLTTYGETLETLTNEIGQIYHIHEGTLYTRNIRTPGQVPESTDVGLGSRVPLSIDVAGSYSRVVPRALSTSDKWGRLFNAPTYVETHEFKGEPNVDPTGLAIGVLEHDLTYGTRSPLFVPIGGINCISDVDQEVNGTYIKTYSIGVGESGAKYSNKLQYMDMMPRLDTTTVKMRFVMAPVGTTAFPNVKPGDVFNYTDFGGTLRYAQCINSVYTLSSSEQMVEIDAITNSLT